MNMPRCKWEHFLSESSPRQLKALRCMRIVDTDRLLLAREDGCSSDGCGRVTVRVGRIESLSLFWEDCYILFSRKCSKSGSIF